MGSSRRQFKIPRGTSRPTRVEQPATHYKALSSDTSGAYTLGEHVLVVDFPPHIHHRDDEGLYVLEGQLAAAVGDERFSIGPGDFIFMPRGVPHALTGDSDPPPRLLFISTPGGFEHLMDDLIELVAEGSRPGSDAWNELEAKHAWTLLKGPGER